MRYAPPTNDVSLIPCRPTPKKPIIAWALYDWANSAFATTVIAAFFPVFFKSYWSAGSDVTESTFQLGLANSLSSLIVVLLAPLLGAIADQGGTRRKFLFAFAFLGVLATGCLYMVAQGAWELGGCGLCLGRHRLLRRQHLLRCAYRGSGRTRQVRLGLGARLQSRLSRRRLAVCAQCDNGPPPHDLRVGRRQRGRARVLFC